MKKYGQQLIQFLRFFLKADTKYQVHSPFVFELTNALLEDRRWYYAFRDVELVRRKMLESPQVLELVDYGTGPIGAPPQKSRVTMRQLARSSASGPWQGKLLFRLAQWLKPETILELGTSVGIGTMYLAAAARQARVYSLEGSPDCVHVAKANLKMLGLQQHVQINTGTFKETLPKLLREIQHLDMVFFDGHHQPEATLQYFEQCLPYAHSKTLFIFDDIYWSHKMTTAWRTIQQHEKVTLTVDCFELGLVFINPDFKSKQHFSLLPSRWKPWKR